jgi:hypothetical protein
VRARGGQEAIVDPFASPAPKSDPHQTTSASPFWGSSSKLSPQGPLPGRPSSQQFEFIYIFYIICIYLDWNDSSQNRSTYYFYFPFIFYLFSTISDGGRFLCAQHAQGMIRRVTNAAPPPIAINSPASRQRKCVHARLCTFVNVVFALPLLMLRCC